MDKFDASQKPEPEKVIEQLLEYNALKYSKDPKGYTITFMDGIMTWNVRISVDQGIVMILGSYPFPVRDIREAMDLAERINHRVLSGAMFMDFDRLVFRTSADLFDAFSAVETLGRALEYNTGIITHFWNEALALAK